MWFLFKLVRKHFLFGCRTIHRVWGFESRVYIRIIVFVYFYFWLFKSLIVSREKLLSTGPLPFCMAFRPCKPAALDRNSFPVYFYSSKNHKTSIICKQRISINRIGQRVFIREITSICVNNRVPVFFLLHWYNIRRLGRVIHKYFTITRRESLALSFVRRSVS